MREWKNKGIKGIPMRILDGAYEFRAVNNN